MPYDIKEVEEIFQTQSSRSRDNSLRAMCFGEVGDGEESRPNFVSEPTLYVDSSDTVIAWYLPHIFTRRRRVSGLTQAPNSTYDIGERMRSIARSANYPLGQRRFSVLKSRAEIGEKTHVTIRC